MLGSTLDLGDDFVEMVVFSTMLGSTVDTIRGDTSSLYSALEARQWIHGAASLRGHSTGAALGQGCRACCVRGKCPDPEAHHSGGAAVAVPFQGRQHLRRCAETASHGLTIQRPLRFSCCSTLTRWLMLVVQVRQAPWCSL